MYKLYFKQTGDHHSPVTYPPLPKNITAQIIFFIKDIPSEFIDKVMDTIVVGEPGNKAKKQKSPNTFI